MITSKEFNAWLDGYITAGGTDIKVVQNKAKGIQDYAPTVPRNRKVSDCPTLPGTPTMPFTVTCNAEVPR